MRFALGVEYDGSQYHGWQAQTGLHTIQQMLEKAVSKVANEKVDIVCSGRTDTGVHALNQVVHFDTNNSRGLRAWVHGTNASLPKDIGVRWAKEMPESFHARYTATSRRYRYIIYNSPIRPAVMCKNVTWQYRPLDADNMHKAAQHLLGEQDFTSFRSVECQSHTPMRNIHSIAVKRNDDYVIITIEANAFLHHMVRNIAGVLINIGSGKHEVSWISDVLDARDRRKGAETAPPYGLYFLSAIYPDEHAIPIMSTGPVLLLGE